MFSMRVWIKYTLAFLLVVPAFVVGGVHILTQAIAGVLACLLAIAWTVYLRQHPQRSQLIFVHPWFWLFALILVITGVQLIPLPLSWIAALSPATTEVFRQTLGGVGLDRPDHWQSLSLAPPETTAKLVRDVGALVVFFVALQWTHQRSRVWWLLKVAVLAAGAMAVLVTVQALLGIQSPLLGLYHPRGALGNPIRMSPFINPNHMGAYNLFHALLCLPLLVQAERKRERALWSFILLLLSAYTFLSLSRGAVIAYALGLLCFGIFFWFRQAKDATEDSSPETEQTDSSQSSPRSMRKPRMTVLYVGAAIVVALGVSVTLSYTGLRQAASETQLSINRDKIGFIVEHTRPFLQHYPWLGVGRGAMPMAWHRFAKSHDPANEQFMITHVESNLTQPLIDWGVPLGILFLVAGGILVVFLILRSKGLLEHSLLIALLALLLQNTVDFNLEYYGTGLPFLIFLAALLRLQGERRHRLLAKPWPFTSAVLGGLGLMLIGVCTFYAYSHAFHRLPLRWQELSSLPHDQFAATLPTLVKHHPSDYMMPIYIARHYSLQTPWKPLLALQWIERGKFLNPTAPELMFLRAYNLARLGLRQQAIEAIDQALAVRAMLVHSAFHVLEHFKMLDFALRNSTRIGLIQLIHARQLNIWPRPVNYLSQLQSSIRQHPSDFFLRRLLIAELYQLWYQATLRAAQTHDLSKTSTTPEQSALEAYQWLQQLQQQLRQLPSGQEEQLYATLYRGHIARLQKDYPKAQSSYEQVMASQKGDHWQAFVALFELHLQQKQLEQARIVLGKARQRYEGGNHRVVAHLIYLEGKLLQTQGRLRQALQRYEDASQLHHNNEYQLAQAHLCWELSLFRCTINIYRSLANQTKDKSFQERLIYFEKEARRRRSQTRIPER